MAIFYSSYDTTFGKKLNVEPSINAIVKASNYFNISDDPYKIIDNNVDIPVDIPHFSHPLNVGMGKDSKLFIDVRGFVQTNKLTGENKVNSSVDYEMMVNRVILESLFRQNPVLLCNTLDIYPASIFGSWFSENISKRFGLAIEDQFKIQIFSIYYYYSLFENINDKPDSNNVLKITQKIARATGINSDTIFSIIGDRPYVNDINDYCEQLEDVSNNIRLKGFNAIAVYPLLKSTWYGHNANELVAVSLEHIPTFISILYAAITERAYKRSNLSKMLEYNYSKKLKESFVLKLSSMLKGF